MPRLGASISTEALKTLKFNKRRINRVDQRILLATGRLLNIVSFKFLR